MRQSKRRAGRSGVPAVTALSALLACAVTSTPTPSPGMTAMRLISMGVGVLIGGQRS